MFRWYQRAERCYVFLTDVSVPEEVPDAEALPISWKQAFRQSRWFTRGWTLQELLAPASVEFFSQDGKRLGSRISLEKEIHDITGIPIEALRGQTLTEFSIETRLSWAVRRTTTRKEDKAYCLLGIFGVFLSLIYGEGEDHATMRLKEEIQKRQQGQAVTDRQDLLLSSSLPLTRNEHSFRRNAQPRSIDYTDPRKDKQWQAYAARSAAAHTREVLSTIPGAEAVEQRTMHDVKDDPTDVVPSEEHDLEAALADLARERSEGFRWQHSAADLLKLLDLYSDEPFRKWLADTLRVRAGPIWSVTQNNALRKAIIKELAAAEFAWREVIEYRLQDRRCLNCGDVKHWKDNCKASCGKCLYNGHDATNCGYPVRCIECRQIGHMAKDC
ncbi:hypothetical protein BCR34DRAFT_612201 [Clohesyomyces aquaticus]|uniref:CCHC-type domain-containing protein n=1 Tax=Clohesyomyces aquaticus TaxID=1231657 RepID=A0A1Y1ZYC1_9PLEO|nr:hypothetical protein BCR34DRAFT_612201 [Clohesyomyces aquaticus]